MVKRANPSQFVDVEIRIFPRRAAGFPLELNVNRERTFPRGYIDDQITQWTPTADQQKNGEELFALLFRDSVLKEAWTEIRGAHPQRRIRLNIDVEAAELHTLPWEALREPGNGAPPVDLAATRTTPFYRYLSTEKAHGSPIIKRPLRMLVAIANPVNLKSDYGLAQIDEELEWGELQQQASLLSPEDIEIERLPAPCSLQALETALGKGFHILHLITHGRQRNEDAVIYLADEQNRVQLVSHVEMRDMLLRQNLFSDEMQDGLRLIFLASCESARRAEKDAFAGLAPMLIAAGTPAVLAMQDRVPVSTVRKFTRVFYQHLLHEGQIDLACNLARAAIMTEQASATVAPVLFMRLRHGRLWYPEGFSGSRQGEAAWTALIQTIRSGKCTPILGPALNKSLIGTRREIAQDWARKYEFPMALHERDDLPQVTQYMTVRFGVDFPRERLTSHLQNLLREQYGDDLPEHGVDMTLDQLVRAAAATRPDSRDAAMHRTLARLPASVFISANYGNVMVDALTAAGKTPAADYCRWNKELEWEPSLFNGAQAYQPTATSPLIYHLFGMLNEPDSLVLTEDDYFDYLIGVTSNKEVMPPVVRAAMTKNALLFLGFRLEEWAFRVLFRSIMQREGHFLRGRYNHIAVQVNPNESNIAEIDHARKYLQDYFQRANIGLYWGSVENFVAELDQRL